MDFCGKKEAIDRMNRWAAEDIPYLFVVDYKAEQALVLPTKEIDANNLLYDFRGRGNGFNRAPTSRQEVEWKVTYPVYDDYKRRFAIVKEHILKGDSYLTNLTCRMGVTTNLTLHDIFCRSSANYKLWMKNRLVCFSPETFVKIENGRISSYPMKGTIKADIPHASEVLMNDVKEAAEHATIVDLIRNDLSMVASQVRVERYRYIDVLRTNRGELLQTSSEISGRLPTNWKAHVGDILFKQLPAGSITGAPKPKTMSIIAEAEGYERGLYTGVMGIYEEGHLDSAVMIRFIDNENGQLFFKAGGGITARSVCESEYDEIKQKAYVPIC